MTAPGTCRYRTGQRLLARVVIDGTEGWHPGVVVDVAEQCRERTFVVQVKIENAGTLTIPVPGRAASPWLRSVRLSRTRTSL